MRVLTGHQTALFIAWTVANTLYITKTANFLKAATTADTTWFLIQLVLLVQFIFGCVLAFATIRFLESHKKYQNFQLDDFIGSRKDAFFLLVYACAHFFGVASYILSFRGSNKQVILAQFIKAAEPLTTALLNYGIFGAKISSFTIVSIQFVVSGLLCASTSPGELMANGAVLAAMLSNVAFCVRNVVCKRLLERENNKHSDGQLFCFASFVSLGIVVISLPFNSRTEIPLDFMHSHSTGALATICQIGLLSAIYQRCSIAFLESANVIDHAIANATKRVFVLVTITLTLSRGFSLPLYIGLFFVGAGIVVRALDSGRQLTVDQLLGISAALIMLVVAVRSTSNTTTTEVKTQASYSSFKEPMIYTEPHHTQQSVCFLNPFSNNFGDELGPAIVKRLLDYRFKKNVTFNRFEMHWKRGSPHPKGCLFGLGSITHYLLQGDYVWGTGSNPYAGGKSDPSQQPSWCKHEGGPEFNIYAVRGELTKQYINKKCGKQVPDDVVLGDPALLLPLLFPEYKKAAHPKHKVCIVPHFNDANVKDQFLAHNSTTRWPTEHFDDMIRFITDCELVASSSLHGIIVAEALGVPARWVKFPGAKTHSTEGNFKYNDYYSATGRSLDDYAVSIEDAIQKGGKEPIKGYDYNRLLESFPYHLFQPSTDEGAVEMISGAEGE